MVSKSWWQRLFAKRPSPPARRKKSGQSTCQMELEILEGRWMPATNILVGSVSGGMFHSNFNDGAGNLPLTTFGGFKIAPNLRSAVFDANSLTGTTNILLDTGTYKLASTNGGELEIDPSDAGVLNIKNRFGAMSTIDAQHQSRHFSVYGGSVATLDHLKLINGQAGANLAGTTSVVGSSSLAQGGSINTNANAFLTLSNDVITGNTAAGYDGGNGYGGAIYYSGSVFDGVRHGPTVRSAAIGGNSIGLVNLAIINTTIDHNQATGSTPNESGANAGGAEGGGLFARGQGAISITASTFSNNQAIGGFAGAEGGTGGNGGNAYGGAAKFFEADLRASIVNSTFANNQAIGGNAAYGGASGGDAFGGAIHGAFFGEGSGIDFANDTIAFNSAIAGSNTTPPVFGPIVKGVFHQTAGFGDAFGGGLFNNDGRWRLLNTIVARNTLGAEAFAGFGGPRHAPIFHPALGAVSSDVDCPDFNSFTDLGHNLIGNIDGLDNGGTCGFTFGGLYGSASHNHLVDPGFAAGLANNGGPTQTIALSAASLAIDAGDDSVVNGGPKYSFYGLTLLTYDQRGPGFPRKVGNHVDIGAFEVLSATKKGRDLLVSLLGR